MPIYEYGCVACGKHHEIIQKINEPLLTICPACGGKLEKKFSLSGFQLKGGGWYKDGYTSSEKTSEKTTPSTPLKKPEKSGK
ncbi:MAG: zinc ribbon domain-containing protein [Deltaproteobacteria bacterium]|nr:zinc ribbon domain-containing protein [Deltaproteobacteria bacterium]